MEMLNALFDFFGWCFSLWGRFFSFVFDGISKAVSAVTQAMSWVSSQVLWPLTLLTDRTAEGIFAWWPLFCAVLAVLLLLLIVIAVLAVLAYHKRKQ